MASSEDIVKVHITANTKPYEEAIAKLKADIRAIAKANIGTVDDIVNDLVESLECQGHESLNGADMGKTVYCDGTCRP